MRRPALPAQAVPSVATPPTGVCPLVCRWMFQTIARFGSSRYVALATPALQPSDIPLLRFYSELQLQTEFWLSTRQTKVPGRGRDRQGEVPGASQFASIEL